MTLTYAPLALLVIVPIVCGIGAGSAAGAARPRPAAHLLAALGLLAVLAGAILIEPNKGLTAGGATLGLGQTGRLEVGFVAAIGLLLLAYHALAGDESALPAFLPPLIAVIAASRLFGGQLLVAASFVLFGSLLAGVLMIGERPEWQASVAGASYLVLASLGGMVVLFGLVLANLQQLSPGGLVTVPFVVAVLTVGLALQLGVAPLHFWLPSAVQRAGPASTVLAVSILGPATFGLLVQTLSAQPQLVGVDRVNAYLAIGGVFTAVAGSVAALAPAKLRRRLGYLLVADLGFALAGAATLTRIGMAGALMHLAHRSLAALVLACAAAELERDDRGLTDAYGPAPYTWGVLLAGGLALAGIPPLGGFAANWAVYQAVALTDWRVAIVLAGTSLVSLVAILAALGAIRREYRWPWRRPRCAESFLMALAAFVALWGFVPGPALGVVHSAVSQLPYLKPF